MKGLSEHRVFTNHPTFLHVCVRKEMWCLRGHAELQLVYSPLCVCVPRQNFPSEMGLVALVQPLKVGKQRALLPNYTNRTFC